MRPTFRALQHQDSRTTGDAFLAHNRESQKEASDAWRDYPARRQHRDQREGSARDCQRPVPPSGRHVHAVPEDSQLPLERHRPDVPDAAPDDRDSSTTSWRSPSISSPSASAPSVSPPPHLQGILAATSIPEPEGVPMAEQMIPQLVEGQEAVVRTARSISADRRRADDSPPPTSSHSACRCTRRPPGCFAVWPAGCCSPARCSSGADHHHVSRFQRTRLDVRGTLL